MNKNYYKILQVDKNASKEIIDKAYKTLAKKYHPDLHDSSNKLELESVLKEINEAYETLSDPEKRKLYDASLNDSYISKEEYNRVYEENQELKGILNNQIDTNDYINNPSKINQEDDDYRIVKDSKNTSFFNILFNSYLKTFIIFFLTFFIIYILIHFPVIKNFLTDNIIFKKIFL